MSSVDAILYKARLAEQVEHFGEMKDYMRAVVEMGNPLTEEQRNLLSVAYKNAVGQRRTAWRIVSNYEGKAPDEDKKAICKEFREKIERELTAICDELIDLLKNYLLKPNKDEPEIKQTEAIVFFYKMWGDYLRYKVEISVGQVRDGLSEEAKDMYTKAKDACVEIIDGKEHDKLPSTHPIRLGLALNFSVYFYEIAQDSQEACKLAKDAFDKAMTGLDGASEDSYKDSTLIMQLLRDNLGLWTDPADDDDDNQN